MKSGLLLLLLAVVFITCKPAVEIPNNNPVIDLILAAEDGDTLIVNSIWQDLITKKLIPYTFDDSVYFLYKGEADSVLWNGDFNGWIGKEFPNKGHRIGKSDIWILKASFHPEARLDYKIVVDGEWIPDPANSKYQYTGVGGGMANSELQMPLYSRDSISQIKPKSTGNRIDSIIHSRSMGYSIAYTVLLPPRFDTLKSHPLLILTDGNEFLHEKLGNFETIYYNLLEKKVIDPLVVVMVDPRNPEDLNQNRRMEELSNNPRFATFLSDELLPEIKSCYNISNERMDIGVGGVSLSGLNAAFTGSFKSSSFGKLAILSPAFWYRPKVYDLWKDNTGHYKVFLSVGTYNDGLDDARDFFELIDDRGQIKFDSIPQGHSWGNWRDLTDDMLIFLYGR